MMHRSNGNDILPHILQKSASDLDFTPSRFMPKYEVKKDRGRNTMVTAVKTKMALF
jgi:hypothetical protein